MRALFVRASPSRQNKLQRRQEAPEEAEWGTNEAQERGEFRDKEDESTCDDEEERRDQAQLAVEERSADDGPSEDGDSDEEEEQAAVRSVHHEKVS